jgi:gas vesicle protein GvpL/GvpF
MAEDYGVWAYAVAGPVPAGVLDGVTGMAGQPVHTVTAAGLTAAVSTVSLADFSEQALRANLEDLAWLEAAAWVHHRVIEAVARHVPVVPMRLATVYRGGESVAAMLTGRRHDFEAALSSVRARTEWGVKVYAAQPRTAGTDAAGGAGGPGAAYLRRRKAALSASEKARQEAAASAEDIHAALRGLAVAALVRPPQGPQLTGQAGQTILNSAYLVDNDRAGGWRAAVSEVASRHRAVRVELTGPWPPYSFAAIDEEPLPPPHAEAASGPAGRAGGPAGRAGHRPGGASHPPAGGRPACGRASR